MSNITVDQMVQREVMCCMSSMVHTLASHTSYEPPRKGDPEGAAHYDLCIQAQELAASVLDYEEAATSAGWEECAREPEGQHVFRDKSDGQTWCADSWEALCNDHDIEPYEWEVFEHWAVSSWLAAKLIAQGERVDPDFAGLNVWARTTTGMGIACDSVMQRIHADMLRAS